MSDPQAGPRRVWGLLGARAGDNEQVQQLVRALGAPYEIKRFAFNALRHLPNRLLGASLRSVACEPLVPPWPDLVVSAGRRTVPVARWIREQSRGRTKLVQFGRPRAPLGWFDLVITTPQYGLPRAEHVLHNTLPFQQAAQPAPLDVARWEREFEKLPRPWLAVLVGGAVWPYRLGRREAAELGQRASVAARRRGGSLLVTTSPRTGEAATHALFESVTSPAYLHDWRDRRPDYYPSLLALADALIVTNDSISMLGEACRTGKPVELYELPRRSDPVTKLAGFLARRASGPGPLSRALETLVERGVLTPPRHAARVHELLVARGAVVIFDEQGGAGAPPVRPLADEMPDTVARVRRLFAA